jgi:SAM-dependent methyltransferase
VPIVELAVTALGDEGGRMLDLGCGNGVLLGKIRARVGDHAIPYGIDREPAHIDHARRLFPAFADNFRLGDLSLDDDLWREAGPFRLAIVGVIWLLEMPPARRAQLRAHLRQGTRHLLVYVYPSGPGKDEDLTRLAGRAGLRLIGPEPRARAALAEIAP